MGSRPRAAHWEAGAEHPWFHRPNPPPPPRGRPGRKPTVIPQQAIERLRKAGGKANGSIRGVGRLLGSKSKTASHRLVHALADAGLIRLQVKGQRGVTVALA
jgi:hypothetical protein